MDDLESSLPADPVERLHRPGAAADPFFAPEERLYRRFGPTEDPSQGIYLHNLKFYPAMSVNRSKYSKPHDVLYDPGLHGEGFRRWGVTYLTVAQIPDPVETSGAVYSFEPRHQPLPENYGHAEIWTLKNGVFERSLEISSAVIKTQIRAIFFQVFREQVLYDHGQALPLEGA